MGTRIGFVASEKGAEKECDVGLGLRMQKTTKTNTTTNNKSFCGGKKMMMMMDMSTQAHHHDHHDGHNNDPSSLLNSNGGFRGEQQHCGGTLFCNTSNNTTSMSDIYDVGSFLFPNTESFMSYNSSAGIMVSGANVRHNIPFTASQRQELETQTMIYRYMMASVPVPPQLLIPITKTTPNFTNRSLELGISSNSSDAEPWRCKRTDGKKWRCSRNVVPDQKYCERHSHKTRPRSRKHVEQNSHFTNATTNINNNNNNNLPYSKPSSFLEQREKHQPAFSATSHDQPRSLEWFMKGHEAANSNQDWHRIVQPKPQQGTRTTELNDINHNNTRQALPQQPQSFFLDQTRQYIDAWSVAERDHTSELRSNTKSMPFSSLALSMHGGNGTSTNSGEDSGENPQMGFGIEGDLLRSQWLMGNNNNNNSASWDNGSPPGGPLAEALCLRMAGSSTGESSSRSS